jgi:hypothetical protein
MLLMQEMGGMESATPSEGGGSASEQLSEAAKERFAQASKQIKQIIKEEKKARKRDDSVARTIMQFLGDENYAAFFPLISHLAARDCPSIFILAILSLIHEPSSASVEDYIRDNRVTIDESTTEHAQALGSGLPPELRKRLLTWVSRLELVMSIDAPKILIRLMVDEENIDGTVLDLTTSALVEFFERSERPIPYDDLQPLTMGILQTVIEPYVDIIEQHFNRLKDEQRVRDDND